MIKAPFGIVSAPPKMTGEATSLVKLKLVKTIFCGPSLQWKAPPKMTGEATSLVKLKLVKTIFCGPSLRWKLK